MRMTVSRAGLVLAALAATAGTAVAQGSFTGNVAYTTDYTWRGISQSDGDPAIQGGFDYANELFYAGVWASNVDFGDDSDTNLEADFYAGLKKTLESGLTWDVGVIYYAYPDAEETDLDFVELKGKLSYALDNGMSFGGEAYYDPDNQNVYVNGFAGVTLAENFSVDGSYGNYSFDAADDYTNWSLGAKTSAAGFGFDLRYWGTDIDDVEVADDRFILTVSRAL